MNVLRATLGSSIEETLAADAGRGDADRPPRRTAPRFLRRTPPRSASWRGFQQCRALVFGPGTAGMKPRDLAERLGTMPSRRMTDVVDDFRCRTRLHQSSCCERDRSGASGSAKFSSPERHQVRRVDPEARENGSMSSTFRRIPPVRCMSATAGGRSSATCSPPFSQRPATPSPASTTSTMPAFRSTCSRAPCHHRYREAAGEEPGEPPEDFYPGEYLVETAGALLARDGKRWAGLAENDWLPPVRDFAIDAMMALIREDLAALGISHDVFSSERALADSGAVEEALSDLDDRDLLHVGVLEPPKGRSDEDWEPRPQTLFRSTAFGDDTDQGDSQIRRQLDLFCYRHGLSPGQVPTGLPHPDRRLGRRSQGLCEAHAVGGRGVERGPGGIRCPDLQPGQPFRRRPAGEDVQARGHVRHAARGGRPRREGCRAVHHADARKRSHPSTSTSRKRSNNRRTIPFSMCNTPMRARARRCATRPETFPGEDFSDRALAESAARPPRRGRRARVGPRAGGLAAHRRGGRRSGRAPSHRLRPVRDRGYVSRALEPRQRGRRSALRRRRRPRR